MVPCDIINKSQPVTIVNLFFDTDHGVGIGLTAPLPKVRGF